MQAVEYELLNLDGAGHQPYSAIEPTGATFDGGHLPDGERLVGYLDGKPEQVAAALKALAPWQPKPLSEADVAERRDRLNPAHGARQRLEKLAQSDSMIADILAVIGIASTPSQS